MPGPNQKPGPAPKQLPIAEDTVTARAPHTYPPGEDEPPMRRPPSRPEMPPREFIVRAEAAEKAKRASIADARVHELEEEVQRLSFHVAKEPNEHELEKLRVRQAWNNVLLKIGGAIATVFSGVALCFAVWAKATLEPRLDATKAVASAQEGTSDVHEARIKKIEEWARLKRKRDLCLQGISRSIFARGLGYDVTTLPDNGIHWKTDFIPKLQLKLLWDKYPYKIDENVDAPCPAEPAPP